MSDGKVKSTERTNRRGFFSTAAMLAALSASYGMAAVYALKFLYPGNRKKELASIFVTYTSQISKGKSFGFTAPNGERYLLTYTGDPQKPYQAFSGICPHLGCKVHWQDEFERYYCPCHGGAFDKNGVATAGPPKQAGQRLKSCPIIVRNAAIYALVERV